MRRESLTINTFASDENTKKYKQQYCVNQGKHAT